MIPPMAPPAADRSGISAMEYRFRDAAGNHGAIIETARPFTMKSNDMSRNRILYGGEARAVHGLPESIRRNRTKMQRLIMIWMTALILQVGIDAQGGDEEGPQGDSRGFETQTFPSQNLADGDDGTGNGLIPDGVSARANVLPDPTPPAVVQYINPDIEPLRRPQYRGKYYRALVPATLDLAERAR